MVNSLTVRQFIARVVGTRFTAVCPSGMCPLGIASVASYNYRRIILSKIIIGSVRLLAINCWANVVNWVRKVDKVMKAKADGVFFQEDDRMCIKRREEPMSLMRSRIDAHGWN